jgi:Flp pilus assembly pilin Flp
MRRLLSVFWDDDEAQDLVEYAMLVVFIAIVLIAAIPTIANAIEPVFNKAADIF